MIFIAVGDDRPDPYFEGHREWCDRLKPLRQQFEARLRSGELVATGFAQPLTPASRRDVIQAPLFELLELDYAASEARCHDLHFIRIEVSVPTRASEWSTDPGAADGVTTVSDGAERVEGFVCHDRYSRVSIRNDIFFLSGGQCTIVRLLHEASKTADPWLPTKSLLEQASYSSNSLSAVFKRHKSPSWKQLIEQKRGFSRLNL